tara:strand:+ start:157 stop:804 length:648 start_codon:yes stop_codon:yes gene_type:complete
MTPSYTGDQHAMACAIHGDCLFDEGQKYVKKLEEKWKLLARPWNQLLDKAVKSGFLGFGGPMVDRKWLSFVLFQPERMWPSGLSAQEIKILRLAKAASAYFPLHAQGVAPNMGSASTAPSQVEEEAKTLKSMQQYAKLVKKQVAFPMWKAYQTVSMQAGRGLRGLCESTYGEPCSIQEASAMFQGDMERGLKAKTLSASPATYEVLPMFLGWISA